MRRNAHNWIPATKEVEITYYHLTEDDEIELIVKVRYSPGYEPYPTDNHDHPLFSDPGSGPELEIISILDSEGKEFDVKIDEEYLYEEAAKAYRNEMDSYED